MTWFSLRCLNLLGTRIAFEWETPIPKNTPLIIVSNHQSTYDIPPIMWHLRKHHPKFISKKELGKGIPSVSFNLRNGGSVLINRKKLKKSLQEIKVFAEKVHENKWSAVIFPEGTRSKNEIKKKFHTAGLLTLMESMPDALIVPISIQNSWQLAKYNYLPIPMGIKLKFKVHKPMANNTEERYEIIKKIEQQIQKEVQNT
ncbi:1-acyl-sn-glycerol-3-phosphate acyltransferase [Flavobacteriaceae bacterium]|nr:1-acyl-sn-glycerol-3-phosphate acyltransferase [Flavobacteriaceae bacterium]